MGQSMPLFRSFHNSKTNTYSTKLNIKGESVDGVLGTRTRGSRMVGVDEVWRSLYLTSLNRAFLCPVFFSHNNPLHNSAVAFVNSFMFFYLLQPFPSSLSSVFCLSELMDNQPPSTTTTTYCTQHFLPLTCKGHQSEEVIRLYLAFAKSTFTFSPVQSGDFEDGGECCICVAEKTHHVQLTSCLAGLVLTKQVKLLFIQDKQSS